MKTALVCGAGGFIGGHLVKKLKENNYWVRGVDIKHHMFQESCADEFIKSDLRSPSLVDDIIDRPFDEVYQLAADMGGAGFIFSGENDADIMHNSALINLNVVHSCVKAGAKKFFTHPQLVYIQNEINKIQQILIVQRIPHILRNQIAITDGKNF